MTSDSGKICVWRKIVGFVTPLLLTVIFLFLAFKDVDLDESIKLISELSAAWLIIFMLSFGFSHYLRALRWKQILQSVKPRASMMNLYGSLMIGYGVNCVVPRLGELYRGLFAGKWENISRSAMLGTVVVERIVDILALAVAVLVSIVIYEGDLFNDVKWLESTVFIVFSLMTILIITLIILVKFKEKFYNAILRMLGKISKSLADKVGYIFAMLADGFAAIRSAKQFLNVLILTALIMLVYSLTSYLGFYMINMDEIQPVSFSMAWIVMSISAFGIVIPTPGGTGSYHVIVIFVLVSLYHFSQEVSAAFALITHLLSYVGFIGSTLLFVFLINRRNIKRGLPKENFLSVFKINKEA